MISQASVLQLIECNEIHIKPLVQLSSSIDWDYSREDVNSLKKRNGDLYSIAAQIFG